MELRVQAALATIACALVAVDRVTAQPEADVAAVDGAQIYTRDCLACHMADGRGVPGVNPSLVDSTWVAGSPDALAGFILTGGYGPNMLMASFDYLNDAELAALMSYMRTQFAGIDEAPIPPALVASMRSQLP